MKCKYFMKIIIFSLSSKCREFILITSTTMKEVFNSLSKCDKNHQSYTHLSNHHKKYNMPCIVKSYFRPKNLSLNKTTDWIKFKTIYFVVPRSSFKISYTCQISCISKYESHSSAFQFGEYCQFEKIFPTDGLLYRLIKDIWSKYLNSKFTFIPFPKNIYVFLREFY